MIKKTTLLLTILFTISLSVSAEGQDRDRNFRIILRHVYEHNPSLEAARAELDTVSELYPQALSGWRPSLKIESDIYSTNVESSNFGQTDGATTREVKFSVDQPIFRGGQTFAKTKKANSLIRAGYAVMLQSEQEIFLKAISAIADVVRDRTLISLRTDNEKLMIEELHAVRARIEGGELTKTDEKQAETRLARSVSEKIAAQAHLESSVARFEETIGYLPPDNMVFPDLIFIFPESQKEMISLAEQGNPAIQSARHKSFAADHEIDAVFRELMPQIHAFASYNKQYDPQPGIIDESEVQTIGVRASLLLYQGGNTRSRVREAKKIANKRVIEIAEIKRRIRQQIISNRNKLEAAKSEISSRSIEVEAAELAREGVRTEAQLEERTVLDILDADQELLDAQAALIAAKRDEVVRHYTLAADMGMLLPEKMGIARIDLAASENSYAGDSLFSMNTDAE